MAEKSNIEWTEASWNPITGCSKYSEGCKYCYAEKLANRLKSMGQEKYRNGFDLTIHEESFEEPLTWKKHRTIFTCSMSDLFHEDIGFSTIDKLFFTMRSAIWHVFQVVTKRAERLANYAQQTMWPQNVWAGVTIESDKYIDRIYYLKQIATPIRFISFEPLLSSIPQIDLSGIDWVIVGGESGPAARPINADWVRSIRDNCLKYNVPFFFKQWGGKNKKKSGRLLDNMEWNGLPKPVFVNVFRL